MTKEDAALVMPEPEQVALQVARLNALKHEAPSELTGVLNTIEGMLGLVKTGGALDHAHAHYITGPLGEWAIVRFATRDNIVWIAVIWPKAANGTAWATWLKERACALHMTVAYSYVPPEQLWLYFGSQT